MSQIQRICPHCGHDGPIGAAYCAHCGERGEASDARQLPAPRVNVPAVVGRAALPLLATAASFAVRAGWRLLRHQLETRAAAPVDAPKPVQGSTSSTSLARRGDSASIAPQHRRTVRIRSSWVVGDAHGNLRHGASEHTIEIDE